MFSFLLLLLLLLYDQGVGDNLYRDLRVASRPDWVATEITSTQTQIHPCVHATHPGQNATPRRTWKDSVRHSSPLQLSGRSAKQKLDRVCTQATAWNCKGSERGVLRHFFTKEARTNARNPRLTASETCLRGIFVCKRFSLPRLGRLRRPCGRLWSQT